MLGELPAFPSSAWVGTFGEYFDLLAPTTEAGDELIWAGAAGAMSALATMCVRMRWGPGFERPILFTCLLGDTSHARKTTAMSDAIETIVEPLRPRGLQPGEPDPFEVIRGQGSGEGLLDQLADQAWWPPGVSKNAQPPNIQTGRSAVLWFDEFGALLHKAERDQAGDLIGFLLKLFDSAPRMQLVNKSKKLIATNASGTVLAASTPAYLAKALTEDLIHAGLVNRFVFVAGRRTSPLPIRPPIDRHAHEALLLKLRRYMQALRGHELVLTSQATEVYNGLYTQEFNRTSESELIGAATARSSIIALRLAMVFAFADGSPVISEAHVAAAWDVVEYSRGVVTALLGLVKSRDFDHLEKKVVRAARRAAVEHAGYFTRSQLRERLHGGNGLTAKAFTVVWDGLVSAGDFVPQPNHIDGGEPLYALNPTLPSE